MCILAVLEIGLQNASSYVALSGDFDVIYSLPENYSLASGLFIRLLALEPKRKVVATVTLPRATSAEVTIRCGVIDSAGRVQFQLVDALNATVAETQPLTVRWPTVTLTLPVSHVTLSDEVTMTVDVTDRACHPFDPQVRYRLGVVYLGRNDTVDSSTAAVGGVVEPRQTVHEAVFRHLLDAEVVLACSMFDREGVYQGLIVADGNPLVPIAVSNEMRVTWNDAYRLSTAADSVLPCSRTMSVRYARPKCAGRADDDKIRLFRRQSTTTMTSHVADAVAAAASPSVDLRYVTERRAGANDVTASFECGFFSADAVGYCFQYVSTANSGAVNEQVMLCVPTTIATGENVT